MKSLLLLPVLLLAPSCDKIRDAVSKAAKKAEKSSATSESTAQPATASGSTVRDLTAAEFDAFIAQTGGLVVVDFHAEWCGPCKQLGPILESVTQEHAGVAWLGKINVDHAQEIAGREGVQGIPDVRFYKDGKQIDQFTGNIGEAGVRAKFSAHTKGLKPAASSTAPATTPADAAEPTVQPMKKDWLPPGMERR